MNKTYFVFILILAFIFIKIAYDYKIIHKKSIFEESKVKKTLFDVSVIDNIFRIGTDLSIFAA